MNSSNIRASVSRLAIILGGLAALCLVSSCHNSPCYVAGFNEGERFQFTIVDAQKTLLGRSDVMPDPCSILPLVPGDSFTLVAGQSYFNGGADRDCVGRSAAPEIPSFAAGLVTSCTAGDVVLGLQCTGETSTACGLSFGMNVMTNIPSGASTITPARLYIGVHDGCTGAGCDQYYVVRIDRLRP